MTKYTKNANFGVSQQRPTDSSTLFQPFRLFCVIVAGG